MIDTPGLNDPEPGRDSMNIAEMVDYLKKMAHINLFLIVVNGSNPRLDQSLVAMLQIFQGMFGNEFIEQNTVFEFSNWAHHQKAQKSRSKQGKDEAYWSDALNKKLREILGSKGNVPAVFIDCLYDDEDEQETVKFEEDMRKLEGYLKEFPPFPTEGFKAVKTKLDQEIQEKQEAEASRDQEKQAKNAALKEAEKEKQAKQEAYAERDQKERERKAERDRMEQEKNEAERESSEMKAIGYGILSAAGILTAGATTVAASPAVLAGGIVGGAVTAGIGIIGFFKEREKAAKEK